MKGLIRKAAAALCCVAGAGGVGCVTYHDLVDPCYPARYNAEARQEVVASYTPQIANGHVLDQTVWNSDFEAGGDRLTGGGMEHLAYMARRRPQPDPVVYVETARDVYYDAAHPNDMTDKRADLDARRATAVQNFLSAQTAGRRGEFQVLVHDPAEVGAIDVYGAREFGAMIGRAVGGLPTGGGSGASPTGGAAPPP